MSELSEVHLCPPRTRLVSASYDIANAFQFATPANALLLRIWKKIAWWRGSKGEGWRVKSEEWTGEEVNPFLQFLRASSCYSSCNFAAPLPNRVEVIRGYEIRAQRLLCSRVPFRFSRFSWRSQGHLRCSQGNIVSLGGFTREIVIRLPPSALRVIAGTILLTIKGRKEGPVSLPGEDECRTLASSAPCAPGTLQQGSAYGAATTSTRTKWQTEYGYFRGIRWHQTER